MKSYLYMDDDGFEDSFCKIEMFRNNTTFCDVTLRTDQDCKTEFKVHKVIMAAKSQYFYTMFTTSLVEGNKNDITLKGINSDILQILIDYSYTGRANITSSNIQGLLDAVHMFEFKKIQDACFEFLRNNMDFDNCIGISCLAEKYCCQYLQKEAIDFACQNFVAVMKTKEFSDLFLNQVISLISSERLGISCESEVYQAIISWVRHDTEERSSHLGELLQYVRFPLLTRKFLIDCIAKEELIMMNPACRNYFLDALDYHLVPERRGQNNTLMKFHPRETNTRFVYAIGGENRTGTLRCVEKYDVANEAWKECTHLSTQRIFPSAVILSGFLYVAGGLNSSNQELGTVEKYDPSSNTWKFVAALNKCSGALSMAVLEGWLYAAGGSRGGSALKAVERYDQVLDEWMIVKSMRLPRSHFGLAVHDGKLYGVGGYCGISEVEHCEVYEPIADGWKDLADLNKARMNHGVAVNDERIFAVGGQNSCGILDSIEKYNSGLNMWLIIKHTLDPRTGAGIAVVAMYGDGQELFIIGGLDNHHYCHNSVKRLNLKSIDYNIKNGVGMLEPRMHAAVVTS